MPVASMTGFARGTGREGRLAWSWEAKSVNARGLDIRCRLPPGMESLEPGVRRAVGNRFKRGNFALSLQADRAGGQGRLRVNRGALEQLVAIAEELRGEFDAAPPSIEGLLGIRGIVDLADDEETDEERERRESAILASLDETLDALLAARCAEGARLVPVLNDHLDAIAGLADSAAASAALQPEAVRRRLKESLAEVLDAAPPLTEERLGQEVALLLVKADVREEIDRVRAHVAAARDLLSGGDTCGRRLDFLCQEFNREANTLCAKATDIELTRIGISLKAAVEQLREQVQNVE